MIVKSSEMFLVSVTVLALLAAESVGQVDGSKDATSQPSTAASQPVADATPHAATTQEIKDEQLRKIATPICMEAVKKIQADIAGLAKQFPTLKGVATQKIDLAEPAKPGDWPYRELLLEYNKNVETVEIPPDPNGMILPHPEKDVVGKDGIKFHVHITERGGFSEGSTSAYDLHLKTSSTDDFDSWVLYYYLETNPDNPALDAAMQKIMDDNVKLLNEKLEPIRKMQ